MDSPFTPREQRSSPSRRLLLWDIDGTLLRDGGIGAVAFEEAVTDTFGRCPARLPGLAGKTDPRILREYLDALSIPDHPDTTTAVLAAMNDHLAARVEELRHLGAPCPGIPELLARLSADDRLINGVLTGNTEPNAALKLATFALGQWLDLETAAYGSDHAERNALVPIAIRRVAETRQLYLDPDDVWVIGDTPADLACARAVGAHCLLVATGHRPLAELAALNADATLENLADTDAVVELLTAGL